MKRNSRSPEKCSFTGTGGGGGFAHFRSVESGFLELCAQPGCVWVARSRGNVFNYTLCNWSAVR